MKESGKVFNREIVKYFAMFTMLLNHIANVFLTPGTFLYETFLNLGYFTAVTMYGKRKLLSGIVVLGFYNGGQI